MKSHSQIGLGVAVAIALIVIGAAAFVTSGVYNTGADDHHTALVRTIIEALRDRSGARRLHRGSTPRYYRQLTTSSLASGRQADALP